MMLPPTQQATLSLSTSLMQSIVEDIEKRRLEEEDKLKGKKDEDKVLKARIKSDEVGRAANAKINEHFFGALKSDQNPMAELISRFLNILGVERDEGETDTDFGTRVEDTLALVALIGKAEANLSEGEQRISLARFRVSIDDLDAVLDGSAEQPTEMAKLAARFVTRHGLTQNDGELDKDYSKRIGETMASVRKSMPESIAALETKAGLRDLGLTAAQMVEAIRNPSGLQADVIEEALDDEARAEGISTEDAQIAIQRLEDIADPKSVEELKLEQTDQPDPTRVENAETRKEREEDIRTLEAAEKLEDVREVQETIEKVNEAILDAPTSEAGAPGQDGEPAADAINAADLLLTLAAGAEVAEIVEEAEGATAETGAARIEAIDTDAGTTEKSEEAKDEADMAVLLARSGPGDAAAAVGEDASAGGVLAVSVDENGIYEILRRRTEASRA